MKPVKSGTKRNSVISVCICVYTIWRVKCYSNVVSLGQLPSCFNNLHCFEFSASSALFTAICISFSKGMVVGEMAGKANWTHNIRDHSMLSHLDFILWATGNTF